MTKFVFVTGRGARSIGQSAALIVLLFAALLQGCALPPAPVDHHYRLTASSVDLRFESPLLPGALRVKRPRADAFTDGTHLLYRKDANATEILRDPYQYWTDAPSLLLQGLLVGAMREAGVAEPVIAPDLRTRADYTLASRVQRLEGLRSAGQARAEVALELSLIRERDQALLFQAVYAETEPASDGSASASVEAFGRALDRILFRFLNDLRDAHDAGDMELARWLR